MCRAQGSITACRGFGGFLLGVEGSRQVALLDHETAANLVAHFQDLVGKNAPDPDANIVVGVDTGPAVPGQHRFDDGGVEHHRAIERRAGGFADAVDRYRHGTDHGADITSAPEAAEYPATTGTTTAVAGVARRNATIDNNILFTHYKVLFVETSLNKCALSAPARARTPGKRARRSVRGHRLR
ncbi:hypothetical protein D9M71_642070 [compost metagenome]